MKAIKFLTDPKTLMVAQALSVLLPQLGVASKTIKAVGYIVVALKAGQVAERHYKPLTQGLKEATKLFKAGEHDKGFKKIQSITKFA